MEVFISQAGILDVTSSNPQIPTSFITDDGTAIPILNELEVLGELVVAGTNPISTAGSGNTVTIKAQISQALAAADSTKVGMCNFDSASFTVDANGFVELIGGGGTVNGFLVDTGTSPVVPDGAGEVTITGATIAPGTTPVQTDGTTANEITIEIQRSQDAVGTDVTKCGLASFNSAQFTVDTNGFVSASGAIPIQFDADTGSAVPALGILTITGTTHVAGTTPLVTSAAGSTVTIDAQISQALAATDATKIGMCNFNSTIFTVDANGFVGLSTTGLAQTITGDSGGALSPIANNWNIFGATAVAGTSPITTIGAGATLTVTAQISQALAAADATKIGLSNFDSTSFAVDVDGFVTLAGGGGFTWNDVSGAFSPLKSNGYFITATANGTLPAAPSQGDTVKFFVDTTDILTITASGTQIIRMGSAVSAAGGTAVNTAHGDSVELTYRTSDTCWCAIAGFSGIWVIT